MAVDSKTQEYSPYLLNVARKNGWSGTGSPVPHLPLTLVASLKSKPKGSAPRTAHDYVDARLKELGLSLSTLAQRQPNRTLADISKTHLHEALHLRDQMQQPRMQPVPGDGDGQEGLPGGERIVDFDKESTETPKKDKQQGEGKKQDGPESEQDGAESDADSEVDSQPSDGEKSPQKGAPEPQKGEGKGAPKPAPAKPEAPKQSTKQAEREIAESIKQQRTEMSRKQRQAEQFTGQPSSADGGGGSIMHLLNVPKDLIRVMNGIIQRMLGGFDLTITPQWDASEMIKRIKTHRPIDPARKYEEGRPAITLACDISGSCATISESTTQVAVATSWSGEFQSDIWVYKHMNGWIHGHDENLVTGSDGKPSLHTVTTNKRHMSTWTWRNGKRVPMFDALKLDQNKRNSLSHYGIDLVRPMLYKLNGFHDQPPALPGIERLILKDSNQSRNIDHNLHPLLEETNTGNYMYAMSADILLLGNPMWVIVFTDSDGFGLLQALLAYVKPQTNIVWVDYRTIPNRREGYTWRTLREDGYVDNRFADYNRNEPTFPMNFSSSKQGENISEAAKVYSAISHAYSPRFMGDTRWLPLYFGSYLVETIGNHRKGRQFYVIPNADSTKGVIEAIKLVAAPEKLKAAVNLGQRNMEEMFATGFLDKNGSMKWSALK